MITNHMQHNFYVDLCCTHIQVISIYCDMICVFWLNVYLTSSYSVLVHRFLALIGWIFVVSATRPKKHAGKVFSPEKYGKKLYET